MKPVPLWSKWKKETLAPRTAHTLRDCAGKIARSVIFYWKNSGDIFFWLDTGHSASWILYQVNVTVQVGKWPRATSSCCVVQMYGASHAKPIFHFSYPHAGERSHDFVVTVLFAFVNLFWRFIFESKIFYKCFFSKSNERLKEEVSFEAFFLLVLVKVSKDEGRILEHLAAVVSICLGNGLGHMLETGRVYRVVYWRS